MPIVGGKGAGRGVVELDTRVVFLQANRVEAEGFVVDAIETETAGALHDQVVGNDLILGDRAGLALLRCVLARLLFGAGTQMHLPALDDEAAIDRFGRDRARLCAIATADVVNNAAARTIRLLLRRELDAIAIGAVGQPGGVEEEALGRRQRLPETIAVRTLHADFRVAITAGGMTHALVRRRDIDRLRRQRRSGHSE